MGQILGGPCKEVKTRKSYARTVRQNARTVRQNKKSGCCREVAISSTGCDFILVDLKQLLKMTLS